MTTFLVRLLGVLLLPILAVLATSAVGAEGTSKPLTRQEFQRKLRIVQPGLEYTPDGEELRVKQPLPPYARREEVVALLGPPDRVEAVSHGRWLRLSYGCVRPGGLGTLGSVDVDPQGYVRLTRGAAPMAMAPNVMPEEKLRMLLHRIHQLPDWYSEERPWNTREVLELVHALQVLGEEKSVALMREYARVVTVNFGAEWWYPTESARLQGLFVTLWPEENSRIPALGPAVRVLEGVPFFLPFRGGIGGSVSLDVRDLLLEGSGRGWRKQPLRPRSGRGVEHYLSRLRAEPGWDQLPASARSNWEDAVRAQFPTLTEGSEARWKR